MQYLLIILLVILFDDKSKAKKNSGEIDKENTWGKNDNTVVCHTYCDCRMR